MTNNQSKKMAIIIECQNCHYKGEAKKWQTRIGLGIISLLLFPLPYFGYFALFGVIPFFVFTNPYYCPNCHKREHLIKILDKGNSPIKSLPKIALVLIWVAIFIVLPSLWFYATIYKVFI